MKAYKLFNLRKDGSIGPLFINRKQRITIGEWLEAEDIPTKGYAHRPGWHCGATPYAPHLKEEGRVWYEVEVENFWPLLRPLSQGGEWLIAERIKVIGRIEDEAEDR